MTTSNEKLINLLIALKEYDCPEDVKRRAEEVLGIQSQVIYENPVQKQLDQINSLFNDS